MQINAGTMLDASSIMLLVWQSHFIHLRATAVPAGTAEARISYGNSVCPSVRLSVCPSVCHDPVVYQAQVR